MTAHRKKTHSPDMQKTARKGLFFIVTDQTVMLSVEKIATFESAGLNFHSIGIISCGRKFGATVECVLVNGRNAGSGKVHGDGRRPTGASSPGYRPCADACAARSIASVWRSRSSTPPRRMHRIPTCRPARPRPCPSSRAHRATVL